MAVHRKSRGSGRTILQDEEEGKLLKAADNLRRHKDDLWTKRFEMALQCVPSKTSTKKTNQNEVVSSAFVLVQFSLHITHSAGL